MRIFYSPHPQPLSHTVGEGRRGARRCALQRVPPLPQTGEGECGVRKRSFRLMLKLRFSTPKGLATNAPTTAV